jgi:hypothetical protein
MGTKMLLVGLVGLVGVALGVGGTIALRERSAQAEGACKTGCKTRPPAAASNCPAQVENGKLVVTDVAEAERVRASIVRGVFEPWFDLGRAPTPDEVGARLELDPAATEKLMDTLAACGASMGFGIHRVPDSDLIAVAWPLSNVPTGIEVTLEGKKPVHARCAIDALGVSKMMGRRASVDAVTRDGVTLHVEVDGERVVQATPAETVVWKGGTCDEMLFFSSRAALDDWKSRHRAEGQSFSLGDAVRHGAELFGMFNQPIRG